MPKFANLPFLPGLVLLGLLMATAAAADPIPDRHAATYNGLEHILDAELSKPSHADAPKPVISVDLLAANSNRGPALLRPETIDVVCLSLDRFKAIGIGNVKFALHYPLLRPDFPHSADYLAFYRQVIKEAHLRGIKVMPHVTVLFADTPFSPFQGIYRDLDLARFKREYRDMVRLVIRELQPDYLGLLTEPDTHARLTGLRELEQPQTVVDIVKYALDGIDRGKTLIGAGSGSWSPPTFARALAEQTDLDFICIHIYPITGPMLNNAREMARIAHANRKQVVIDEAWLYKILRPGGGNNVAASADVFRLDTYSFWQPLDRKFMSLMLRIAAEERISLVSFFWSNLLFSYADYSPEIERLGYRDATRRFNRAAYANMQAGRLSPVGEDLRRLAGNPEGR